MRLLGGRRARFEGRPPRLAAAIATTGRLADQRTRRPPTRSSRTRCPAASPRTRSRPAGAGAANPFLLDDDDAPANPFAPPPKAPPPVPPTAPRKLRLLARGSGVVGSYAKILVRGDETLAYCQFGPLTAYPRAQRTRDLYPQLPDAPLPAVITCIATVATARREGLGVRLVEIVCADLAVRGFAAVEAYPEVGPHPDATSGATPAFWETAGFVRAVDDPRFPVMRRELT